MISERFKTKCEQSGITLYCSSPCHHQANSLAERSIGTCKTLLRKALEEDECPYTALWIYRTTPLDDQVPSPHELMFGRKPQTRLPCSRSTLKSKHPSDDLHQKANQRRQERQAAFYNRKTESDKRPLNPQEPVFVWNTLKKTWQRATVLNRPQPTEQPRTCAEDIHGKIYQRTREHLRPRSQVRTTPPANSTSPPASALSSVHDPKDTRIANDMAAKAPWWQMISRKTAHQHSNSHLLQSCLAVRAILVLSQRLRLWWAKGPATNQRVRLPGQGVSPRFQSSLRTEWRRKYTCEGNFVFLLTLGSYLQPQNFLWVLVVV